MSKYYVNGCRSNGGDIERCDDSEAQMWALYERGTDGLSQGIIDCNFREDAEAAMAVYAERDRLKEQVRALTAENADLKHPGTYLPSKRVTLATDAILNEVRAQVVDEAADEVDRWVGNDLLARELRSKADRIRAGEVRP